MACLSMMHIYSDWRALLPEVHEGEAWALNWRIWMVENVIIEI